MDCMITSLIVLGKIMNLGMAIVTWGNAIISRSIHNLFELQFAKLTSLLSVTRLKITAASAAAIIVGLVGMHLHKVLLPHH